MDSLLRELQFALKDRVVLFALLVTTVLSSYSLINGLQESKSERATIEKIKNFVNEDRTYNLAKQSDAGGAAYYAFHFTYDVPSDLAFIARGIRDDLPWKHRIRMLALEGQIYETDSGNPELSLIGKLDFVFISAFLLPLLIILLLYDLRATEIRNNRWAFLSVTNGNGHQLLRLRATLRSVLLFISITVPFFIALTISDADYLNSLIAIGAIAINVIFWCIITLFVISRIEAGATSAALLLSCWLILAVAIPVGGKLFVEHTISAPQGGEILLQQRETVNGAWDLPKEKTMVPFLKRHPQWADSPKITRPFEWKWYYAFQQVGDQSVEHFSQSMRSAITQRDKAMHVLSFASPILLTERLLTRAANTDITAFQFYENCVRDFHLSLRKFHYPMLFGNTKYSNEHMKNLPSFTPCTRY